MSIEQCASNPIPEGVEKDTIKAEFSKGVLEVTLPKTKEVQARQRRIPVKSS
jgi:HSP20 family protein